MFRFLCNLFNWNKFKKKDDYKVEVDKEVGVALITTKKPLSNEEIMDILKHHLD